MVEHRITLHASFLEPYTDHQFQNVDQTWRPLYKPERLWARQHLQYFSNNLLDSCSSTDNGVCFFNYQQTHSFAVDKKKSDRSLVREVAHPVDRFYFQIENNTVLLSIRHRTSFSVNLDNV